MEVRKATQVEFKLESSLWNNFADQWELVLEPANLQYDSTQIDDETTTNLKIVNDFSLNIKDIFLDSLFETIDIVTNLRKIDIDECNRSDIKQRSAKICNLTGVDFVMTFTSDSLRDKIITRKDVILSNTER